MIVHTDIIIKGGSQREMRVFLGRRRNGDHRPNKRVHQVEEKLKRVRERWGRSALLQVLVSGLRFPEVFSFERFVCLVSRVRTCSAGVRWKFQFFVGIFFGFMAVAKN